MASGPVDWVLHVDLDQFLAAVEVARNPELKGRPVVVGGAGDPTQRGVVATASYEARAFGVRSGMPLRTAARRCPDAVFLASDPPAYNAASEEVMGTLRGFGTVEVLGWDEAFLAAHTLDPVPLAHEVRAAVATRTGLACSVGVGDNRLRAKVATGFAKPGPDGHPGVFVLTREDWAQVMGHRPTEALWGVGAKTARKLAAAGITTVAQLAQTAPAELAARFGPRNGPWLRALANGVGGTEVTDAPYRPKSRSREVTFQTNVTDPAELDRHLVALAARVADDIAGEGRPAVRVAVKVRFAPFFTHTHSVRLPTSTSDPRHVEVAAREALGRFELGRPVRLLGVRADLTDP